jgi:hypothetical protein
VYIYTIIKKKDMKNELLRRIGTQLHNDRIENTDMVQYPLEGKAMVVEAIYDSMEDIDELLGWA